MSVRAYQVLQTADDPSFNCWHDEDIMDIASLSNYDDGGLIYLEKDRVQELLKSKQKKMTKLKDKKKIEELEYDIKQLKDIIKDMGKEDSAEYICY